MSPHQEHVWSLLSEGLTNREIAGRLFLAEGTVKNRVSEILREVGARNRTHAAAIWWRRRRVAS